MRIVVQGEGVPAGREQADRVCADGGSVWCVRQEVPLRLDLVRFGFSSHIAAPLEARLLSELAVTSDVATAPTMKSE